MTAGAGHMEGHMPSSLADLARARLDLTDAAMTVATLSDQWKKSALCKALAAARLRRKAAQAELDFLLDEIVYEYQPELVTDSAAEAINDGELDR